MSLLRRLARAGRPGPAWTLPTRAETDPAVLQRDLDLPPPRIEHVTFFTPRSGSTWLADVMSRTRRLGHVREAFNPRFLPKMAQSMNATTLDEYCAVVGRRWQTQGVFGFQITHHQLSAVFGQDAEFLSRYPARHALWLVRRDIVQQAVSLHKMETVRVSHAPRLEAAEIAQRDSGFAYDAAEIRRWIRHIRVAERDTETLIAEAGLEPLRMTYEHNVTLKPNHLINVIAHHLGLPTLRMKPLSSPHRKIATDLNRQFAERFRDEERGFVDEIDAERAPMLDRVGYYGPRRPPPAG